MNIQIASLQTNKIKYSKARKALPQKVVLRSDLKKVVAYQRPGNREAVLERLREDSSCLAQKRQTRPFTQEVFKRIEPILAQLEKTHPEYVAVGTIPGKYYVIMNGPSSCLLVMIDEREQNNYETVVYTLKEIALTEQSETRAFLHFKYYGPDNPNETRFFLIPKSANERRSLVTGLTTQPFANSYIYDFIDPPTRIEHRNEVFQWSGIIGAFKSPYD